jgi:hypothetical protein
VVCFFSIVPAATLALYSFRACSSHVLTAACFWNSGAPGARPVMVPVLMTIRLWLALMADNVTQMLPSSFCGSGYKYWVFSVGNGFAGPAHATPKQHRIATRSNPILFTLISFVEWVN